MRSLLLSIGIVLILTGAFAFADIDPETRRIVFHPGLHPADFEIGIEVASGEVTGYDATFNITLGNVQVLGTVSPVAIRDRIAAEPTEIRRCYFTALDRDLSTSGNIVLAARTYQHDPMNLHIVANDTGSDRFGECVGFAVRTLLVSFQGLEGARVPFRFQVAAD